MVPLAIIFFFVMSCADNTKSVNYCKSDSIFKSSLCKTQTDSLTKKEVYISADLLPENEGGQRALMRQYTQIVLDTIPDDYDTEFIVAFIVDIDGTILGERIIKDKTNRIGSRIINIAKSFKWTPAACNGKKVAMLHKLEVQMCFSIN